MEAILLVGGLGTRLRPLTDDLPKPMLPVAGVPLVVHQIARARAAGVDHVVLATSYRAEVFADALGDGSPLGVRIDYAVEDEPLGTGGAIRNAAAFLQGEVVLVFNGDVIDGHDIRAQLAVHHEARADATLYLTRVDDARAYGCVPTDSGRRVIAFHEKMAEPVSDQINAGCYVFRRAVIDQIPPGRAVSVERETFPGLLEGGGVLVGLVDDAYWRDLGTPESYVRGCADVVLGLVDTPARPGPAGEALVLPGADVSPSAQLRGGTCVGRDCAVGEGAVVDGSVLLDGAIVGSAAIVRASAVGRKARAGAGAVLD
ncbi:MAG: sugar phosphate nucleotidyltransferase, partial [Jiangellaceae bacterium]